MNEQPIEKRMMRSTVIEVREIFKSIQGEGPFAGTPAIFIRLAGCNLQCPYCDTDYTSRRFHKEPAAVALQAHEMRQGDKIHLCVITGGEPFRQPIALDKLVTELIYRNFYVQIETNGTLNCDITARYSKDISKRNGVFLVCSPKTHKVHPSVWDAAVAWKYVLCADHVSTRDGLPLNVLRRSGAQVVRPPEGALVYVQPTDAKDPTTNDYNREAALQSCLRFGYIFQPQLHKMIGVQ